MDQNNINEVDNYSNISVFNEDISIDDLTEISSNQEEDELLNISLDFNRSVKTSLNLKIENENNQLEIINEKNIPLNLKSNFNPPKISKLKPKQTFEPVSPMKLNIKFFGFDNSKNKKINEIVYNYTLDKNEAKSCNEEETDDYEIEEINFNCSNNKKNDLKINEIKKEMKNFKNDFIETGNKSKEYENILNSDSIFNKNKNQSKRKSIFKKHIQLQEETNSIFSSLGPLFSFNVGNNNLKQSAISNQIYRSNTIISNSRIRLRNSNISILGVLESAANEKKRRNTVIVI